MRNEASPGDSRGGPERKISLTEECKGPGTQNSNREEEAQFSLTSPISSKKPSQTAQAHTVHSLL